MPKKARGNVLESDMHRCIKKDELRKKRRETYQQNMIMQCLCID
jgi:hypothetical protein